MHAEFSQEEVRSVDVGQQRVLELEAHAKRNGDVVSVLEPVRSINRNVNARARNGATAGICFMGDIPWYGGPDVQPGGSNAADWTGGYAQGSNVITLANVGSTGIRNGSYIYLDQANDTTIGPDFFVCDAPGVCRPSAEAPVPQACTLRIF